MIEYKKILVLGAGRSSSSLIRYLISNSGKYFWKIIIADVSLNLAKQKAEDHPNARAISFDIHNELQRKEEIKNSDLVISLMPPAFHFIVAQTCVEYSKHLLTASYVSPEINELNQAAIQKNILILMETGLDPGIDHMSAMKEIEEINSKGAKLNSFKSYTGGLVAPESDNNPWHYKITWNPRNVVLAGQGVSKFQENGEYKELTYKELFKRVDKISVKGYGDFEGYANRDSLKYMDTYKLNQIETFFRGTLRRVGYCSAWNVLVQIGLTDDSYKVNNSESITYRGVIELLVKSKNIEESLLQFGSAEDLAKIKWLGLLENVEIGLKDASPADILQKVLEEKLKLQTGDIDMIVMQHQFEYTLNGKSKKLLSSLVVKGEDEVYTAMAKTVGLPLGIAAKLLLEGKISQRGVQVPVSKEIYEPILKELESMGIVFQNEEFDL